MTENIKLLLKYEGKKKIYNTYVAIAANVILLIILIVETLNTLPQISDYYKLNDYVTFKIYQIFAITLTALSLLSVSCIRDIRNYRYLLGYPIKYEELFGFIKIRKFKNYFMTIIVNLLSIFFIGIRFRQNFKFFLITFFGIIAILVTCYLICDIVTFSIFSIFPSNSFITLVSFTLCSPAIIIINSMKNGSIINFQNSNKLYVQILDNIYPYCKFTRELLFSKPNITYIMFVSIISLVNIVLLLFLYEKLIKITFFKVLEKEDSRRSNYSNINISSIRPQNSFKASLLREAKFLLRENKSCVFNLQAIIISILAMFTGIMYKIFGNSTNASSSPSLPIIGMEKGDIIIILTIYLASLLIDFINYTLNTGRFALGGKYLSFEKYIQLNPKNTLYSILLIKIVIALSYYLLVLILLYLFNLLGSKEMWAFIICIINVITVVCFDTIIDVKLPNLYNKMSLINFLLDLTKPTVIILFKALHFFALIILAKYFLHNILMSLIIVNLIFLVGVIVIFNSKNMISNYTRLSYIQ